ncbi:MAG: alpha/beta fold hydrolase [Microscillaceae bacterium]|jgi:predicted alpha/beta hydrolase|nr:alpha/beta fold hydrolase [Microscillaceae bacterium]
MEIKQFKISAKDGFQLSARLYIPDNEAIGIMVVNAGTCIRQNFYQKIAEYLVGQNYLVLTYDYRGVGESKPDSLRGFRAKISDWAVLDMTGVFEWVKTTYPNLPKYLLAHSMGGQIIGLSPEILIFAKIITVASSYGNYQFYMPDFQRLTKKRLIFMRWAEWWYGYIPAAWIGGEPWAKGVSKEWRSWGKHRLAFSEIMHLQGQKTYFKQISVPFRAYFVEDDIMATPATIPYYQQDFRQAQLEIIRLGPDNQGIGHFGFFTGRVSESIWQEMKDWLQDVNDNS